MLHHAVEAFLFYRKIGIRKLCQGYPRIYVVLCKRSRVYGVLNNKGRLWLEKV